MRPVAESRIKRSMTDYELDMYCFSKVPWKHPIKHEFLIRGMQGQWGDKIMFEETINGTRYVNYWATRIVKEMCQSPIINEMGCGSSGKTGMTVRTLYTIWKSAPFHTSVFLSTTTGEASDARAWAVVQEIYREDVHREGKLINSARTLVMEEENPEGEEDAKFRDLRNSIKCVLIPTGNEGRNVVGAISGRKNHIVIWQCDEFPHMDLGVLAGRANLFTNVAGGGWAQFIGCGNGPKDGDAMFIDAEPVNGWTSINKDEHWRWETRSGVCLYFNGEKSPNMQAPEGVKVPFPRLMDRAARAVLLKNSWNDENTPEFYTQFYGFPPSINIPDTVLTIPFLKNGGVFNPVEWEGTGRKTLAGLDLGFRQDGDPCCLYFGKIGKDTRGKKVLESEPDSIPLNPNAKSQDEFNKQIAKLVVDKCRERDCHDLALDVTGDGGILLQAIEREAREQGYQLNCLAVSFSGTAEDRVVIPGEKRVARDMYANMVAQLWAGVRVCVGNSVVRGMSEKGRATRQLCQRKFATDAKRRFTVESKKEMKKRIKRSPDDADSFVLLVYLALRHGLSGTESLPKKQTWETVLNTQAPQKTRYSGHRTQHSAYTGR